MEEYYRKPGQYFWCQMGFNIWRKRKRKLIIMWLKTPNWPPLHLHISLSVIHCSFIIPNSGNRFFLYLFFSVIYLKSFLKLHLLFVLGTQELLGYQYICKCTCHWIKSEFKRTFELYCTLNCTRENDFHLNQNWKSTQCVSGNVKCWVGFFL